MGKFINTDRKMTIDTLVDSTKDKLKNPYYKYNNTTATVVTYYNIDTKSTSVDEGLGVTYSNVGSDSSLRFNKINDMFLFGIDIVKLNLDDSEFGIEASGAQGDAVILPNTIVPNPGDYFKINHTNQPYLFRVDGVDIDTLEDGANAYAIKYSLNRYSEDEISTQILDTYTMVIDNVGTEMNPIIRSSDYELIGNLDDILILLKKYYEELFFDTKVQSFIYFYQNKRIYDSYLTEFLIRNKLLSGGQKYIYICHQTNIQKTFSMDYDRTIFRSIELQETDNVSNTIANVVPECDPNSILNSRFDDYYSITYHTGGLVHSIPIEIIPSDVAKRINTDNYSLYKIDDPYAIYNIMMEYLMKKDITISTVIDIINKLHYCDNKELFYGIPIVIYIVEYYIKNLLKATNVTYN
jgi:hypothetical protein